MYVIDDTVGHSSEDTVFTVFQLAKILDVL